MNRILNKKKEKGTKSLPAKNKKLKEKLFLPINENNKNDFNNNNNKQTTLETKNIFDENYLIDFKNMMKKKFKVTKSLKVYKKTDNNKKNINKKTIETNNSKRSQTKSQNKKIRDAKNINKKNQNNENKNDNKISKKKKKRNENNDAKNKETFQNNNNNNDNNNVDNNKDINKINMPNNLNKNNNSNNSSKTNISKKNKNKNTTNNISKHNRNDTSDNNNTKNTNSNNDTNDKSNNTRKSNIRRKNVSPKRNISPKKNVTIKVSESSPIKSKDKNNNNKLRKSDKFQSKNKETISTNIETLTIEKEKNEEDNTEENNEMIKAVFTPIPTLLRRTSKVINGIVPNVKDVEKAINLRRQQYNEYLRSLNKPKPKPKPKPKIYDLDNVVFIQKMYKGFQIKDVNQTVQRLKINLCVTELLCLIFNNVFRHARKRITFYMFKTYYHDPFTHIFTEVNFTDKLAMKLSDTYYNFNNFY